MPIRTRRLKESYEVGNGPVVLRIIIGEGQFGSSVVNLGTEEIASGGVAMLRVGDGPSLAGQRLKVASTVTDVQRSTNRTSITFELDGGPVPSSHELNREVDKEGGSVLYIATFDFV